MTPEAPAPRDGPPPAGGHVLVEQSAGVLTLTLNRPEKKNALTVEMYGVLGAAIDRALDDPAVRCILLQGNGDSFTAGNDLSEFAEINSGARERIAGNALITALARIAEENRHFTAQLKSPEAREAFAAFRDRRRPDFSQRG